MLKSNLILINLITDPSRLLYTQYIYQILNHNFFFNIIKK